MSISTPNKITVPFANSGNKNTIPVPSQIAITTGAASFTDGFPPLTMTPKASGGVPPFGQDMNGILFAVTQALQFSQAGGSFVYDSVYAASVGGYPQGATVAASDFSGYWINTIANNTADPEAFGSGWKPYWQYGTTPLTMTNANITLTALQAAKPLVTISGTLTANLNLVLPTWLSEWTITNNTTGNYTITAKTAAGSGVALLPGANQVYGNGTSILYNFPSALIANDGYQPLPSGLIVQWLEGTTKTSGVIEETWPKSFPNAVLNVVITEAHTAGWGTNSVTTFGQSDSTLTTLKGRGARIMNGGSIIYDTGLSFYAIAIGY